MPIQLRNIYCEAALYYRTPYSSTVSSTYFQLGSSGRPPSKAALPPDNPAITNESLSAVLICCALDNRKTKVRELADSEKGAFVHPLFFPLPYSMLITPSKYIRYVAKSQRRNTRPDSQVSNAKLSAVVEQHLNQEKASRLSWDGKEKEKVDFALDSLLGRSGSCFFFLSFLNIRYLRRRSDLLFPFLTEISCRAWRRTLFSRLGFPDWALPQCV